MNILVTLVTQCLILFLLKQRLEGLLKHSNQFYFKFEPVSEAKVQLIIKNLKSKSSFGHDNISTKILLKLLPILCQPVTLIINQSLRTGKFPDRLKIAKIIPVYKKEDPNLIKNYCPISILSSISKVFEKVVYEQIYSYLITNNYLCNNIWYP